MVLILVRGTQWGTKYLGTAHHMVSRIPNLELSRSLSANQNESWLLLFSKIKKNGSDWIKKSERMGFRGDTMANK